MPKQELEVLFRWEVQNAEFIVEREETRGDFAFTLKHWNHNHTTVDSERSFIVDNIKITRFLKGISQINVDSFQTKVEAITAFLNDRCIEHMIPDSFNGQLVDSDKLPVIVKTHGIPRSEISALLSELQRSCIGKISTIKYVEDKILIIPL